MAQVRCYCMLDFQYPWQALYAAALTEVDPSKLKARVTEAESTLHDRLRALENSSDGFAERQAIQDALFMLQALISREE